MRLFVVEHERFEVEFCEGNMFGELVWLRLCSHSSLRSLSSMSLLNLRVLEIHGSGENEVRTS